jgi:hypothetical protein
VSSPRGLPVVVIACQVLQDMLERLLPGALASQVTFMDYGLHRVPQKMTGRLQQAIDVREPQSNEAINAPSLVVLGYGLCGNGLKGLRAGKHTLLVPRTDDCIAILLGSYRAYMREFQAVPGTYYLTKGWLESGSNPLQEYEAYVPKYGAEQAMWVMDQQYRHYERLVLVAHHLHCAQAQVSQADLAQYRPQAQEVARFCQRWGMRYEEILGSDAYVRRLVEAAQALGNGNLKLAEWMDDDFVVIPPGGEIRQDMFMR